MIKKKDWVKKISGQIFFRVQRFFGTRKYFPVLKNFWVEIFWGVKNKFGKKKLFWVHENFCVKKWWVKKYWALMGGGVGLLSECISLCVEFETSRMLSSGIFWWGCCYSCYSCSCCCDRGKTKSTPSPRTWNWSLTKIKIINQCYRTISHRICIVAFS